MLIKKPNIGTRLGLGDVDPVQPLNLEHPLLRGVQGFWLPLPHLSGGNRLYDLSPYGRHGSIDENSPFEWSQSEIQPILHSAQRGSGVVVPDDLGTPSELTLFHWWNRVNSDDWEYLQDGRLGSGVFYAFLDGDSLSYNFNDLNYSSGDYGFGVWNYTMLSIRANAYSFYANGQLWSLGDSSLTTGIGSNLRLFTNRFNEESLLGSAGGAVIWHRALGSVEAGTVYQQARRGFPDLLNRRPAMTAVEQAVAPPPDAVEADVTTTQAAQLTSADTLVYRTLDAATLQALQTVSASVIGIFDASASTRQQQQRAEAAADVVATITLDAVTRQAQQGTAASVLLRAKIDALTRQQPQLAQIAAEIVGIISAAAETQQQPQRATADLQSTIRVSVGTQQQPQAAAAIALVATILQTVTRQLPQRTTAAFGDLVRARIQATSIRRAIDLQTSITRP